MMFQKFVVSAGLSRISSVVALACFSIFQPVSSQGFVYEFREVFDGAVPEAPPPWLTAQIENAASGGVDMVIATSGLTGMETVRYLYFNLNPAYDSKDLSFQALGTGGAFAIPSFGTGTDHFKAGGDGLYDIRFGFSTSNNESLRFNFGDSLTLRISGIVGLVASDFAFLSQPAGGWGPFYAAAHVQSIGLNQESGWIYPEDGPVAPPVPEPSGLAILGIGMSAFLIRRVSGSRS